MSENTDIRFRELASRCLDATHNADEEAELLELLDDPERRQAFLAMHQIDRELAALSSHAAADEVMVARVMRELANRPELDVPSIAAPMPNDMRRVGKPVYSALRTRLPVAIAIAAGLALVAVWLGRTVSDQGPRMLAVATVKEVSGEVSLIAHTGTVPLLVGQQLTVLDGIETGAGDSRAVIEYPDGTRIELGSETAIGAFAEIEKDRPSEPRKRVRVLRGNLTIDAAKQPADRPMIVMTPQAEVLVVGTKFSLEMAEEGTQVSVAEGAVRMRRRVDRQSIDVPQGSYAIATPDIDQFAARPIVVAATSQVRVFHASRGVSLGHYGGVAGLAFSRDGKRLATGSLQGIPLRIWDVSEPMPKGPADLAGHTKAVWSTEFSPDGKLLASGGDDKTVRLTRLEDQFTLAVLPHKDGARAVAFSPNGKWLATGGNDSVLRLRDPLTGDERAAYPENDSGGWSGVYSLAFSPDSKLVAAGLSDRRVRVRSVENGEQVHLLTGHTDMVYAVAFSPDGRLLASASHLELMIWDVATGELIRSTNQSAPIAFSADSKLLAVGGAKPGIVHVPSGRTVASIEGIRGGVNSVAFQPGRSRIAFGHWRGIVLLDLPIFDDVRQQSD